MRSSVNTSWVARQWTSSRHCFQISHTLQALDWKVLGWAQLKFLNVWADRTLDDLKNLVRLFGVPGKHFHLSIWWLHRCCLVVLYFVYQGTKGSHCWSYWLATQTKGVLKVFIEEELVLECSQPDQSTAAVYTALIVTIMCLRGMAKIILRIHLSE